MVKNYLVEKELKNIVSKIKPS